MRLFALALVPALLSAAPALQIVRPAISQMEGGAVDPPGADHVPGEVLFFSCRVAGYTKSPEEQIHLAYSVQAFNEKGVPLTEEYTDELKAEVSPQDKEWQPKIATEIPIPPLIGSGDFKIVVKVEDRLAGSRAENTTPFKVRGRDVAPSDTLVVRNFRFFRDENDESPAERAIYKPGDGVWAKFDITGFKYGEKNSIEVSYVTTVIAPSGKVLWTQPEPAVEKIAVFLSAVVCPGRNGDFAPEDHPAGRIHDRRAGEGRGGQPDGGIEAHLHDRVTPLIA